jgi:hypothetical protein
MFFKIVDPHRCQPWEMKSIDEREENTKLPALEGGHRPAD